MDEELRKLKVVVVDKERIVRAFEERVQSLEETRADKAKQRAELLGELDNQIEITAKVLLGIEPPKKLERLHQVQEKVKELDIWFDGYETTLRWIDRHRERLDAAVQQAKTAVAGRENVLKEYSDLKSRYSDVFLTEEAARKRQLDGRLAQERSRSQTAALAIELRNLARRLDLREDCDEFLESHRQKRL